MQKAGLLFISLALAAPPLQANAQEFPNKPIKIIAAEVGASADTAARVLATTLGANLKTSIIVENHGGAGGIIAIETVKNAPPDGYTVLFHGSGFWTLPLMQKTPYEPLRDFAPVILAVSAPSVLVTHPSLPVNSVKELIAYAKARPGQLNYGGSATASGNHLAGELFKAMAGIDVTRIPYKGGAPTMTDLLAGRLNYAFATLSTTVAPIKAGKIRALGVTSEAPSELFPSIPPIARDLPDYESGIAQGMYAPAKTPKAVVDKLNAEARRALLRPDIKDKFLSTGVDVVASTPEQFVALIKTEMTRLGKVIKDAGITSEESL